MMKATIHNGSALDVLRTLPDGSVHTCVTSPPYWGLRDYGHDGQLGLEPTPEEYVANMVDLFREVRRVLRDDGTLWLNLGDSYTASQSNNGGYSDKSTLAGFTNPSTKGRQALDATKPRKINHGLKPKNLIGIPWRVAFALQADGWYLRQDIIWHKPNPMPESVRDRCTKSHEYIFLLTKSPRYFFDQEAIKEKATATPPGNVTHKHTEAFENGDERHRTKSGLVDYAKRQRARLETYAGRAFDNPQSEARGPNNNFGAPDKRNKRSVWTVTTQPFPGAHFAVFPPALIEPCVRAGSPEGGTVLDPFSGSGTTGLVALGQGRNYIGIELNPEYVVMSRQRLEAAGAMFYQIQIVA